MIEKTPDEAAVKKATEAMKEMVDEMEKAGKAYKPWGPIFGHNEERVDVREWNKGNIQFRSDTNSTMKVHAKAVGVNGDEKYTTVTSGNSYSFYAEGTIWDYVEITGLGATDEFYAFGYILPGP